MDIYHHTVWNRDFIISTDTVFGNNNKTSEVVSDRVPIPTWKHETPHSLLLYDKKTHMLYQNTDDEIADLSVEGGEDLDNVKRFGEINCIGNVLIIHKDYSPEGYKVFEPITQDIQAMYRLPLSNEKASVYALYRKDEVTLLNLDGTTDIKAALKKVKDKNSKLTAYPAVRSYGNEVIQYEIDTTKVLESSYTVKDFLKKRFSRDETPTFITINYDIFNQAFLPKKQLPKGAEPLTPEEYEKFGNIKTNTTLIPFKKDNNFYAITLNNRIVNIGSNPKNLEGIYAIVHDKHKAIATVTKNDIKIYKTKEPEDNKFSEAQLYKEFNNARGFGVTTTGCIIEDEKGVVHTYGYDSFEGLFEIDTPDPFVITAMLKNTLSGFVTSEAVKQFQEVLCK